MKNYACAALVIASFAFWLYGYQVSASVGCDSPEDLQIWATNVWMKMDALAKALLSLAFAIYSVGVVHWAAVVVAAGAANNFIDEFFYDPFTFGWSELAISNLLSIYITYKLCMIYGKPK